MSSITVGNISDTEMNDNADGDDNKMYTTSFCSFTKSVLVPGEGFSRPLLKSKCKVASLLTPVVESNLNGKKCDQSLFLSEELDQIKDITIGMCDNLRSKGLETMLMTMQKGEKSHFHVWWRRKNMMPSSNSNTNTNTNHDTETSHYGDDQSECECYVTLVLHNFTDEIPIWHLSAEEKYEQSLSHKIIGTNFFQEDRIEAAFYQYSSAMKYLLSISNTPKPPEADNEKYKSLRSICYLNLAACQLKCDNFDSVIENCTKALTLDAWNVKGLYRRAVAYKNIGKIDQSRSDLIKIVKKQPKNQQAADLLESLMPLNVDDEDVM